MLWGTGEKRWSNLTITREMVSGPDVVCKPSSLKRRTPEASSRKMLARQRTVTQRARYGTLEHIWVWRYGDNAKASLTICQARERPLEKGVTEE